MKMKVGLETVVSEMPETIVKNSDQSYLETVLQKSGEESSNFQLKLEGLKIMMPRRFWRKKWRGRLWIELDLNHLILTIS